MGPLPCPQPPSLGSMQEKLWKGSVLLWSPQSLGVSTATCAAALGLRDRPPTTGGSGSGTCPTSIRGLGWGIDIRGQSGHFTTSTQDSLSSRRRVLNHFPVFENNLSGSSQTGGDIPSSYLYRHTSPTASLRPSVSLPTPEHADTFLSPSLGGQMAPFRDTLPDPSL